MQFQAESRAGSKGAEFERLLADALRRGGWRIIREPSPGDVHPDLVFARGDQVFIAELKRSSEGRRDRLIPLISQAILQAQASAKNRPGRVVPVAIVAAPRVAASVADEIKRFADEHAPDVVVGVMDAEGFRAFWGHGLEQLNTVGTYFRVTSFGTAWPLPKRFSTCASGWCFRNERVSFPARDVAGGFRRRPEWIAASGSNRTLVGALGCGEPKSCG